MTVESQKAFRAYVQEVLNRNISPKQKTDILFADWWTTSGLDEDLHELVTLILELTEDKLQDLDDDWRTP